MGMIKSVLWTASAVGIGVFLASYKVEGKTPLEHAEKAWKANNGPSTVERLKGQLAEAYENARDSLANDKRPSEHHSAEDRAALNKLIAKQAGGQ